MTRLFILLIPVVLFLFPKETHSVQKEATTMTDVGKISINIQEDGQTVPARIRFLDSEGECVIPEGAIGYQRSKSFVCDGETSIEAPAGKYRLEVLRGTEYKPFVTDVVLEAGRSHSVTAEMDRWIDMNALGWYSGDLHVHWPVEEVPLLMRAVELNLCTIQSLWNENSFWKEKALPSSLVREVDPSHLFHVLSAEDERDGGAVLIFGLEKPIDLTSVSKYFPSSLGYVEKGTCTGSVDRTRETFLVGIAGQCGARRCPLHGTREQPFLRGMDARERGLGKAARCGQIPRSSRVCSQLLRHLLPLSERRIQTHCDCRFSHGSASQSPWVQPLLRRLR